MFQIYGESYVNEMGWAMMLQLVITWQVLEYNCDDSAFRIRFWETSNALRMYDILTDNQYKLPNSNDSCMQLRALTACSEWNEGMDEDVIILHWLSKNAGLTSECVTEVIELFTRR